MATVISSLMLGTILIISLMSSLCSGITVTGRILCNSSPVVYAKVRLYDVDINSADDELKNTYSDLSGNFAMTVTPPVDDEPNGSSDVYIKVEYKYWLYGTSWDVLTIEKIESISTFHIYVVGSDVSDHKSMASTIDFGTLNFNNEYCKTYVSMVSAIHNFAWNINSVSPVTPIRVTLNSGISSTTPITYINDIYLPDHYDLTSTRANYEYARAIMHREDGDLTHYNIMSNDYNYDQVHDCVTSTNYGDAFDHGFAAWWSGSCTNSGSDYKIDGNVAYGIEQLQTTCGTSDNGIWNVTGSACAGSIHSFYDFNNKHYELYHCKI